MKVIKIGGGFFFRTINWLIYVIECRYMSCVIYVPWYDGREWQNKPFRRIKYCQELSYVFFCWISEIIISHKITQIYPQFGSENRLDSHVVSNVYSQKNKNRLNHWIYSERWYIYLSYLPHILSVLNIYHEWFVLVLCLTFTELFL